MHDELPIVTAKENVWLGPPKKFLLQRQSLQPFANPTFFFQIGIGPTDSRKFLIDRENVIAFGSISPP